MFVKRWLEWRKLELDFTILISTFWAVVGFLIGLLIGCNIQ